MGGNVVDVVVDSTAVVGAAPVVGAAVDGAGAVGAGGAALVGGGLGGVVAAAVAPAPRMTAVNPVTNIHETVGFIGRQAYPWRSEPDHGVGDSVAGQRLGPPNSLLELSTLRP